MIMIPGEFGFAPRSPRQNGVKAGVSLQVRLPVSTDLFTDPHTQHLFEYPSGPDCPGEMVAPIP
jgi:hypothetical protein